MRETISHSRIYARTLAMGALLACSLSLIPSAHAQGDSEKTTRVAATELGYTFAYTYPARVAADPAVAARLKADVDMFRTQLKAVAKDDRQELARNASERAPVSLSTQWAVEADTPVWLSLSGKTDVNIGSVHGATTFTSLLWDKAGKRDHPTEWLFTSSQALETALQPALCDELDRERAKRRGAPVVRDPKDWATSCLTMRETLPVLASSDGVRFDRIRILIAQYIAGPSSEGPYELTLPVTAAVLSAVKPEFKEAFAAGR